MGVTGQMCEEGRLHGLADILGNAYDIRDVQDRLILPVKRFCCQFSWTRKNMLPALLGREKTRVIPIARAIMFFYQGLTWSRREQMNEETDNSGP